MSKAKRLLDILLFLNTKHKFTAQELADEFQLSVRTIHRYLLDLSEMGLPLYTEQGRNGGYTLLKSQRFLPPILFTEEEAVSIFFAFQSLRYYNCLPFETEISAVAHKLYHSLPHEAKLKVDHMRSYIAFWNPKRSIDAPYLHDVLEAAIANQHLRLEYHSKAGETSKYIHPIGVYAHDGLWYLPAYDLHKERISLLRVDRIVSITAREHNEQAFMNLEEWFASSVVEHPIRLHVLLTQEGVRQCSSTPGIDQYVVANDDGSGYIDAAINKAEVSFIVPLFLRLGNHAHVQEPPQLIDEMRQQAKAILELYS